MAEALVALLRIADCRGFMELAAAAGVAEDIAVAAFTATGIL